MTDEIDRKTFMHMVELAALELDEQEGEYLRRELNHQLQAIHELEAIPLDEETPAASHGVPYTPEISAELREDIVEPFKDVPSIMEQAPESDDGYIVVPEIPHEDLE
jgi:aspartyl-tRNA(Asn)/glutamyl-tRNA(Gln) amidotransferase subunit C